MRAPRRRLRDEPVPAVDLRAGFGAVRDELGVPDAFGERAQTEAAERARDPLDLGARTDLTDVPFVTLDPPGSRDLDQALWLARRPGGFRVRYAIADTAAFVVPGGALDAAVRERVETVYCPDVRVPLHPPVLGEGAASLLPDETRPAVVWSFDLDAAGAVTSTHVERALVRSRAQLDYPTQQARLDAGVPDDDPLALLSEIGRLRAALEVARGGVSLGRPEQEVVPDGEGRWTLAFRAALPVEDHNAQLSLMTGMAAADLMLRAGLGVLRTMPAADPRDVDRLRRQAQALGVPWPAGAGYGEVLRSLDPALPSTAAFLAAATALFRGAAWTPFADEPPADPRHGAVGAPYAHVTAPLRRLVDRFGLEVCLAACAGRPVPEWVIEALPGLGATMAAGTRRSGAVDRACTDLVEAVVLAPHVGETFEAVALDDRTVQLAEPAVVARVEGDPLPDGDVVRVRLVTADPPGRTVLFRHDDGA